MKIKQNETLVGLAKQLNETAETLCVIFDLDDTLFDTRSRTKRILDEYVKSHTVPEHVVAAIHKMTLGNVAYFLRETLQNINILDLALCKDIESFWRLRFFSGAYVVEDQVFSGCHDLIIKLKENNVEIIYLTGRSESDNPENDMRQGTKEALLKNSFPFKDDDHLIMKKDSNEDDCIFKERVCKEMYKSQKYKILASFENQPENANMMVNEFNGAKIYLHQSIFRPIRGNKEIIHDQVICFSDYHSL